MEPRVQGVRRRTQRGRQQIRPRRRLRQDRKGTVRTHATFPLCSVSDPFHFDADPRILFRDNGSGSEQIRILFFLIFSV